MIICDINYIVKASLDNSSPVFTGLPELYKITYFPELGNVSEVTLKSKTTIKYSFNNLSGNNRVIKDIQ